VVGAVAAAEAKQVRLHRQGLAADVRDLVQTLRLEDRAAVAEDLGELGSAFRRFRLFLACGLVMTAIRPPGGALRKRRGNDEFRPL